MIGGPVDGLDSIRKIEIPDRKAKCNEELLDTVSISFWSSFH